ncbi:hypothetical protein DC366_09300 [Pelagivirga sediminicola]|uniref:Lipoprotein n=1 Tax=Pelagivirga sediminicola TaxID=2170575 RepID=A0A2T7G7Q5_9RHOB|nr:hypothetical protein [Pelagivirga sediminicola]PVA10417.1 hypothetical protein DC366_09300 [Pelagivirga sediminicola]
MMRLAYGALAALCLTGPTAALSCLPHDVAATFQRIEKSEDIYMAVHGTLDFDAGLLPQTDWADQRATPPETRIPARLVGRGLGKDGFTHPVDIPVTLRVLCLGPWCASPPAGADVMAFVQKDANDHVVSVDACGGDAFFQPSPETLSRVQDCFEGRACASEQNGQQ